jgi:hypothetical protein
MSLTSPIPDAGGTAYSAVGLSCFYCGEPLFDPAVYWMGHTGEIYLHPPCVLTLFVRLARDLHEIDCPIYYAAIRRGLQQ